MARTRIGSVSPERYTFRLYIDGIDWFDLSDITACSLSVQKPSEAEDTWVATLEAYDPDLDYREGSYLYQSGDLDESGDFRVKPIATVAADVTGPVQWPARTLKVWAEFE
jgi:hypothetical protein